MAAAAVALLLAGGTARERSGPAEDVAALGELSGNWTSPYARYRRLPAAAPTRTSLLRIQPDGYSLLTLGIAGLEARASVRGGLLELRSDNRWFWWPQFAREAREALPDPAGRCAGAVGRYRYERRGRGLSLAVESDRCRARVKALTIHDWRLPAR